uniref:Retrotransposon gag domain-containing protein n=1 Tax=Nelumbo nucifera TaxID=4432 RepID=A0A822ZRT9_NELNU|nr:TPA_asm: hypothetical protein HUJ06_003876 [Nelumbo nucifera]
MKNRLTRDPPRWEEYVRALNIRFGSTVYEDPMSELLDLRQAGSVQEYQEAFEELLNRVEVCEEYAVSCFLSGLKEDIQMPVRMFMPKTLHQALSLARIQEVTVGV